MIFLALFVLLQKQFSIKLSASAAIIGVCTTGLLVAGFFQIFFEEKTLISQVKEPVFLLALAGGIFWGLAMIFIAWVIVVDYTYLATGS